jgi:hypothetical protein
VVALWVITGHAGEKGTRGEGKVLVTITLEIVWLAGNADLAAARWADSLRR